MAAADGRRWSEVTGEMFEEKQMKAKRNNSFASRILRPAFAIALSCGLGSAGYAVAQTKAKATTPAANPPVNQRGFATSKEAATALIQSAEKFDVPALLEIVGPGGTELVVTKDTTQDKQRAATFAAKAHEKTLVTQDPKNPNRAILSVGNEDWPYPVPIVKQTVQSGTSTPLRAARKFLIVALEPTNWTRSLSAAVMWTFRYNMRSKLMMELISTRSESSARPGSMMGLPGKMKTAPGVVRLERVLPKPCSRAIRRGLNPTTVITSRS